MTGLLTAACLCLTLGQTSDVYHTNQRGLAVPVNVQESARANYATFLLYESRDQGRSWTQVGNIPAAKSNFAYYAPGDGAFWLQVATVNRAGVQEPDEKTILKGGTPVLKMQIDTLKPIIKSFQADRHGDEIVIRWDVQEDHPDLSRDGMRLEYQVKDTLIETWKPVPFQAGLTGQTSFNPGTKQNLIVRLLVRDLAGNQSYSPREVAGTIAPAGFTNPPGAAPIENILPGGGIVIKPAIEEPKRNIMPPPPSDLKPLGGGILPPPPTDLKPLGGGILPPVGSGILPPTSVKEMPKENVVADSRTPPAVEPAKGLVRDPLFPTGGGIQPLAHSTPAKKPLPMLQYVNQHLVKLQYEIKRQGPSGIGGVQIWLTKDDGETWAPYAEVKDLGLEVVQGRQERDFEFRDKFDAPFPDGVYGLNLVVKNRAGLGREPRPGDAPEIRIEIDTKPPEAQLFKPMADPQNPTQLLLKWNALDKNLADAPIHLEYAEKPDGVWQPIELNLKNTGRFANQSATGDYSWKVPPGTPVQVYLRLRVRDKAGNESIAVTREPQFVDLVEPEGALIGILPQPKRP